MGRRRLPRSHPPPWTRHISVFRPKDGTTEHLALCRGGGALEFFDGPGFHPRTGKALTEITRDFADKRLRERADRLEREEKERADRLLREEQKRADLLQRQEKERADRQPFKQNATQSTLSSEARMRRSYTETICLGWTQDRTRVSAGDNRPDRGLKEYAEGKRPGRINIRPPEFFDPRTSEPIVWYVDHGGAIEIFDLLGYHPETGEELLPVTPEIVDRWKAQQAKPPAPVDPDTYPFSTQRRDDRTFGTLQGRVARSNSLTARASTRGRATLSQRSRATSRTSDCANVPID